MSDPRARLPFVPQPATPRTREIQQQLLTEGARKATAKEAHWRSYTAFCERNALDPREDFQSACSLFAAALVEQHRMASTVKVYLKHIQECLDEERPAISSVMRALDIRTARQAHSHAMDLTEPEIAELLSYVYAVDPARALVLAFMWCTGVRCQDLSEIRGKQVMIDSSFFRVEVRLSKTAHHALDRAEIRVPVSWIPDMPEAISIELLQHVQTGRRLRPDEPVFGTPTTEALNHALENAWKKSGRRLQFRAAHKCPTSYTMRRSFMHRVALHCTHTNGDIDFELVCKYTLHKCAKTARAYYNQHVSDLTED
jgi:integrase